MQIAGAHRRGFPPVRNLSRNPAPEAQEKEWTVLVYTDGRDWPAALDQRSSDRVNLAVQDGPADFADFLTWGMKSYPARHYLVIVKKHEMGFAEARELRTALEKAESASGRKPEVLALDGCLMQSAELGYELRDRVQVVSASPEVVGAEDFPYDTVLESLVEYPDRHTPKTVGSLMVQAHRAEVPYTIFTAVDTNRLRDVPPAMKLLVKAVEEEKVPREQLYTALLESANLEGRESLNRAYDVRDLVSFAEKLEARTDSARVKLAARELRHAVRGAVLDHSLHPRKKALKDSHGPTVYLPWKDPGQAARADYEALDFARDSGWNRLMDYLYQGDPVPQAEPQTTSESLSPGQKLARTALFTYKKYVSPYLGVSCPYDPSCSQYTRRAIEEHGVVEGVKLGFMRLISCDGHGPGGADPVPNAPHHHDPLPSVTVAPPVGPEKSPLRRGLESTLFTAARVTGKVGGALAGALVSAPVGLVMGAVLGWKAGSGSLDGFYQGLETKYGEHKQESLERLVSPVTGAGRFLNRHLGDLLGGVAGAVTGAVGGGLGGAWMGGRWGSLLGGLALQNITKDALGELPVHVPTEAILQRDY